MITSKQNPSFKLWMKLKTKKYRDQTGLFLVFGDHQIEKAHQYGAIKEIVTANLNSLGTKLDPSLMKEIVMTETYVDTFAVCEMKQAERDTRRILFLDDIQDPDNLGALLRSAAAFGFLKVIISHRSADFYNEKTIRAAKGAIFDLELIRGSLSEQMSIYKRLGYRMIGADAHGQTSPIQSDKLGLVLGNEGHGLSQSVIDCCDGFVRIETSHVESLNVSVAGGILMHQWRNI